VEEKEKKEEEKAMGMSEENSSERSKRDNTKKRVEWTYSNAWSSPP